MLSIAPAIHMFGDSHWLYMYLLYVRLCVFSRWIKAHINPIMSLFDLLQVVYQHLKHQIICDILWLTNYLDILYNVVANHNPLTNSFIHAVAFSQFTFFLAEKAGFEPMKIFAPSA